jgi:hypothetical protein
VLKLSDDGCRSFSTWDPTTLPPEAIDPAEKPEFCAPKGLGDCRYDDFRGEREPAYSELQAVPGGAVSFLVRSKAFKGVQAYRVTSDNFGRTWQVTAVPEKEK